MKKSMMDHYVERFADEREIGLEPELPECLNVEINNTCNHKCIFCGFHSPYIEQPKHFKESVMKTDVVYEILEQAKRLGIGRREVGFYTSGEVFLHKDFSNIVRYAKELGFTYTFITTNGVLAVPQKMKEVIDAGLDSIRFSVNGADRKIYEAMHGRDDFDTVLNNIKFLRSYLDEKNININTSVSVVVTKENRMQIPKMKEIFKDLVDEILFIPVMELKDFNKDLHERLSLEEYIEKEIVENKELHCPLLYNTMYIDSNCKVRSCCYAFTKSVEMFDLNKEMDLEKAWYSSLYKFYRKAMLDGNLKGTICEGCAMIRQGVSRGIMEV